ncbi:MAG: hypothetical protein ACRDOI_13170 [Trebonia sp.]
MHNAEEFPGQRSDPALVPTYRQESGADGRAGPRAGGRTGSGRIRYAHSGTLPRVEPFCSVPQGLAGHHAGAPGAAGGGVRGVAGSVGGMGAAGGVGGGADHGDVGAGAWLMEHPDAGRHGDLWVLVCGGIAAAAAFAAAFVASGGMASHPATPGATMPAVVSQACPAPAPSPSPGPTP